MSSAVSKVRLLLVLSPILLVAACANRGENAQASMTSSQAAQDKATADKAMATAQQALQVAQQAQADAKAAEDKANMMYNRNLHK
ncbi:MAG TPA: hypothetical protein VMC10_20495 [Stellaceae bacterium]|nr:hypothetical protein [Stellaceae bacterium]